MPGKHFDLDIDINLGGENASDNYISSQKATKTYIDQKVKDIKVDDASWGKITGILENQKDLKTALDAKANTSDLAKVATTGAYTDITGIPTNVSEFTNDAGYLTEHQDISGKADKKDTYTKTQVDNLIPDVSTYNAHIANTDIHVTSEQKTAWTNKQDAITDLATIRNGAGKGATAVQPVDLGTAATTNSYTDLDNLPTIPTITNTYSATGTDGVSGKAVASAIQGLTKTVITFRAW